MTRKQIVFDFLYRWGDAFARLYGFGKAAEPMPRWMEIAYSTIGWLTTIMVIYFLLIADR